MSKWHSTKCKLQNSFDDMIAICSLSKCNTFKLSRLFFANWVYIAIYHHNTIHLRCLQRVYRCHLRRIKQNGAQVKWLVEHSRTCTSVHPYYVDYRQTLFAVFILRPVCYFFLHSSLLAFFHVHGLSAWTLLNRRKAWTAWKGNWDASMCGVNVTPKPRWW